MADELEVRHLDGLRADVSGGAPKLVGLVIPTCVLSEVIEGAFREVISPEAVRRTLESDIDLIMLHNHDSNRVLGRVSAKTLRVAAGADGLHFELDPPQHAHDLVESVRRGDVTGASFRFSVPPGGDRWDFTVNPPIRTVTDMRVRELSAGVVFPAYKQSHVAALRSLDAARAQEPPMEPTTTTTVPEPTPPVPPAVTETRDVEVIDLESRVLAPGDSFRSWVEQHGKVDAAYKALGFGQFIRAMVCGPRNDLERRALAEGTDSAGGYTVPDIVTSAFIDRLRAAMVTQRAGARTVPLTSDKTTVARLATDPTVAWRLENAEITASDATFEGVVFVPRSLACLVRVSRELLEDSVNIDRMLERAFAESMAVEVDRVALIGTGTPPEPKGISATTNVGSVAGGGALTSWDKVLDAVYEVLVDNGPMPTSIVMPPRTFIAMAKLKQATTNAPLPRPPLIDGLTVYQTSALPITEAPGTASRIMLGDFTQLLLGIRSSLRVEVLRERYAEFVQYGFLAHLRADVALEHPEAFAMVTGIVP